MSLTESFTGDEIYNPFVRIYIPKSKFLSSEGYSTGSLTEYHSLNSRTFGEISQRDLIPPEEIPQDQKLRDSHYRVTAVVVEQSSESDKRPMVEGHVLGEIFMGYLDGEGFKFLKERVRRRNKRGLTTPYR
tara:strand:+ start:584 stop:976 length:393 start_codon:yes stop_codon:yes gene_type:complete